MFSRNLSAPDFVRKFFVSCAQISDAYADEIRVRLAENPSQRQVQERLREDIKFFYTFRNAWCCEKILCQNHQILYFRIFCSLHGTSFFFCLKNVFHNLLGDHLAWRQDRDTRRITHNKFTADLSCCLCNGKRYLFRIKRLLW